MAFFDNFGKRVGEAAQAVTKKSGDLVEVTKLNMSISAEEEKIKKTYEKLGELVYSKFDSGDEIDPNFIELCDNIRLYQNTVNGFKTKIMELKNVKPCTKCGTELEKDVLFCPKCGEKQK